MGIHGAVKSAYLRFLRSLSDNTLMDVKWFVEQEINSWGNWIHFPVRRRLWLWRHGFTSPYGKLYDLDTYGPEAFLSELQRYRLYRALNGDHRYLLDDKLSQHWMLAAYPENRPDAYGFLDRGRVHGVADTEIEEGSKPVAEWLPQALQSHSKLVLKHLRGKGGKEVIVCEYDEGYYLDGSPVTETALCDEIAQLSGYLITEYVEQHDYAEELYPHSPNTIRLFTLWDDTAQQLLTPMAVHRIGTDRSRPIDNFSVGGVAAEIDLETGELSEAVQFPFTGEVNRYTVHPDSGTRIEGARVPHWETIRSTIEAIARNNTHIPAIGWDVLLDTAGTPIVLEANTGTDFDMMQAHRPFLEDAQLTEVVSRHLPEVSPPSESPGETRGDRRSGSGKNASVPRMSPFASNNETDGTHTALERLAHCFRVN